MFTDRASSPSARLRLVTVAGMLTLVVLGGLIAANRHLLEDEVATLRLIRARGPADVIRLTAAWDVHPPLSYLCFDLLDDGHHDRLLMIPGIVLGALAAGWFFARTWPRVATGPARTWLWLATFLSPATLLWGVSIRWYALFLPLATWALGLAMFANPTRRARGVATVILVLATWISHLGLVVALLAAGLLVWRTGRRAWRDLLACAAIYVAAVSPSLWVLVRIQHGSLEAQTTSLLAAAALTLVSLVNSEALFPLEPAAVVHGTVAALLAWAALARRPRRDDHATNAILLVAAGAVVLATTGLGAKARNAAFLWPWVNLVLASSLARRRATWAWVLVALSLPFFGQGAANVWRGNGLLKARANLPVRQTVALADSLRAASPGRIVVLTHEPSLAYALERVGLAVLSPFTTWPWPDESVPLAAGDVVMLVDGNSGSYDRAECEVQRAAVGGLLTTAADSHTRQLGHDRWFRVRDRLDDVNEPREWAFTVSWGRLTRAAALHPYPRVPLPGLSYTGPAPWLTRGSPAIAP